MRYFLIFTLLLFSATTFGQEVLIDLQSMPVKKNALSKPKVKAHSKASSSLPFYDDFSKGLSYPDPDKWFQSSVLINQTYAINQPTIGVATFDAMNRNGKLHSHLTTTPEIADTLTSKPINLVYNEDDSLYLSFWYQPKGLGKQPETTDSLVVDFFAKDDNEWVRVWGASPNFKTNKVTEFSYIDSTFKIQSSSSIDSSFFCAMIPIKDARFLKDTFQFRIMNYASFPPNLQYPSLRGNCDHWHIDLVYINVDRDKDDTIIEDVAFTKPTQPFLKNYVSIPWKHMNSQAMQSEFTNPHVFKIQFRNFFTYVQNVTVDFLVKDLSNHIPPSSFTGGAANYDPSQIFNLSNLYDYSIESNWEDSAKYLLKSVLTTESGKDYLRWNDTVSYTQSFYNYYSYDDGSAEFGYGLWGEGSQNGMMAVKYHSYEVDSLKGVLIYFNQIADFTRTNFELVIWSDNNGKPGTQLYKKLVLKPLYAYNTDTLYKIDSKLKIGGDFWVGTINYTEDLLNIGFDMNNNHSNKIFYNLTGEWQQTSYAGSLMIKPVFGKFTSWQTGIDKPTDKTNFSIYPNPAKNSIRLNIPEGVKPEWIRVINLTGQVMISKPYDSNSINIDALQTGIYLFQLTLNNRTTSTQKLVIIK
ncbi:MAG TPA: hypothetical protein DIW31_05250 [Bacteroidales bacterium]|nr:hypothetical protein [Bacteroidales bacterium]